ncbi:MAG: NUDIX hydrolase [Schleiferiaceae bacterium]|jgi:8-oxo-dGTP pyrophosphatase MutT (NUDIX family)|nr:NUDIX hydrolase [Schleiferiaceae bacterium]
MNITVRVYAFLVNEKGEVLLLNEQYNGIHFTKLPGGGLEKEEGILECIHRELNEELNLTNLDLKQIYTTEDFILSKFHENTQVLAVYYEGHVDQHEIKLNTTDHKLKSLNWVDMNTLSKDHFTFQTDKKAFKIFTSVNKI